MTPAIRPSTSAEPGESTPSIVKSAINPPIGNPRRIAIGQSHNLRAVLVAALLCAFTVRHPSHRTLQSPPSETTPPSRRHRRGRRFLDRDTDCGAPRHSQGGLPTVASGAPRTPRHAWKPSAIVGWCIQPLLFSARPKLRLSGHPAPPDLGGACPLPGRRGTPPASLVALRADRGLACALGHPACIRAHRRQLKVWPRWLRQRG
jgi:hypothetical protein